MNKLIKTLVITLSTLLVTGCGCHQKTTCKHVFEDEYTCHDRTCTKCGYIEKASTSHEFEDNYTCHDRECIHCGYLLEATSEHNYNHNYECSDRTCLDCGYVSEGHGHKWVEVEESNYLVRDELDITANAKYYKSCEICHAKSTETFVGEKSTLDYAPTIKKALTETKKTLKFHEDGSFKILVTSDTQFKSDSIDNRTIKLLTELVKQEKPDFVMIPGDVAYDPIEETFKTFITKLVSYLEESHTPWGITFGNHDYSNTITPDYTPQAQMEIYNSFEYCLARDAEPSLPGCSNYNIPILSSDGKNIAYQLWSMDTKNGGIEYQQKDWYVETSNDMKSENGDVLINSMMFFHIPLPEMTYIYEQRNEPGFIGHAGETPCIGVGNTSMFTALKEVGDVRLVINAHDHVNDFIGTYDGIDMCYTSTIGYQDYRDEDMMGGRVINLNENDLTTYETHMVYAKDLHSELEHTDVYTEEKDLVNNKEDILDAETPLTSGQYISTCWNESETPATFEIESGKGFNNSSAYKVTKSASTIGAGSVNSNIRLFFPEPVTLGTNEYLRLWMDIPNIDFRKASWGLIGEDDVAYNTDNLDNAETPIDMFMLYEGTTEWRNNLLGSDGCFGPGDNSYSLKNFRGFMAFNIKDLVTETTHNKLTSTTKIKGLFLYYDVKTEYRDNNPFYFDRVALCEEYNVFKK